MSRLSFRSAFCFLLLLTSVLVGCHRHLDAIPSNLTKVALQADWYPQPEHGGFYTALVKGYYREEGLDLIIVPGGPFAVASKQVASGAAQFGMDSSDHVLEGVSEGEPLVAVAATMQRDPQGIMVRKDSPVLSFADLDGHTVAVKAGSTWFEFIVKRYHLDRVRRRRTALRTSLPIRNTSNRPLQLRNHFLRARLASRRAFSSRATLDTTLIA